MEQKEKESDNIELRSEKVRNVIGKVPAQWKFSGDKHKFLQVDTERTFHQQYPLVML